MKFGQNLDQIENFEKCKLFNYLYNCNKIEILNLRTWRYNIATVSYGISVVMQYYTKFIKDFAKMIL